MSLSAVDVIYKGEPVSAAAIADYARLPIAFRVESILCIKVESEDSKRWRLTEIPVQSPYDKDYDAIEGEMPSDWIRQDTSDWRIVSAYAGDLRVGGAVIAPNPPPMQYSDAMKGEGVAVLWDIRVHPQWRGRGIGSDLFRRAADYALSRGCIEMAVETQNINVPACKLYSSQGCDLIAVNRQAYPDLPHEIRLIWSLDLGSSVPTG